MEQRETKEEMTMSTLADKPAFPTDPRGTNFMGITIFQYFVAHAPPEPQGWFHPVMEERRGKINPHRGDLLAEWDAEFRRQKYAQWPIAWAKMMIAELEKQKP